MTNTKFYVYHDQGFGWMVSDRLSHTFRTRAVALSQQQMLEYIRGIPSIVVED